MLRSSELLDAKFARNLKRWVDDRKIRESARHINFSNPDLAQKALHDVVVKHPNLFRDQFIGLSSWQIAQRYYNLFTAYGKR